jgi:hypothetical protein
MSGMQDISGKSQCMRMLMRMVLAHAWYLRKYQRQEQESVRPCKLRW